MSKLPVLVLAYNRPDLTAGLMEKIAAYAPERLYVACDGARASKAGDDDLVQATRSCLTSPSWRTAIHARFLSGNQGLRQGVEGAIGWFFDNEAEGIILEDDCHPTPDFFKLAEHVLDRYRDNGAVWGMTGSNSAGVTFPDGVSYGFIRLPLIWGWASWADRWQKNDSDLVSYPGNRSTIGIDGWPSIEHKLAFQRYLDSMVRWGNPDSWAYRWAWSVMSQGGLWIVPDQHLVSNEGFRQDATNTSAQWLAEQTPGQLSEICPTDEVKVDKHAELTILRELHGLLMPLWLNYPMSFLKKVKKNVSRIMRVN